MRGGDARAGARARSGVTPQTLAMRLAARLTAASPQQRSFLLLLLLLGQGLAGTADALARPPADGRPATAQLDPLLAGKRGLPVGHMRMSLAGLVLTIAQHAEDTGAATGAHGRRLLGTVLGDILDGDVLEKLHARHPRLLGKLP